MANPAQGKVVVHGGLEKAASTFLQQRIFPNVPGFRYFPELRPSLLELGKCHWSHLDETVVAEIGGLAGSNAILSSEGLVCVEHAYDGQFTQRSCLTIGNLAHLLGHSLHLVVILRRQDTAIDSMIRYKQRYLSDPMSFLVDFPAKRRGVSTMWDYRSLYSRLLQSYNYYHHLAPAYDQIGPDRITLLPYEALVDRPESFFAGLSEVFDTDIARLSEQSAEKVNARSEKYSDLPDAYVPMSHFVRRLNNLSGYLFEKLFPSRQSALTDGMKSEIMDIFRDSNRQLSDLFKLDLDAYGYY